MKNIFKQIGKKLISNDNFLKWKKSKIEKYILEFCIYSWWKLLNEKKVNVDIDKTPFNLLYDSLTRYETKKISEDTKHFMINWLLVIYFTVLYNSYNIFIEKYGKEKDIKDFLNKNNYDLYTDIIKIVILELYKWHKKDFLELFYNNDIIKYISDIFDKKLIKDKIIWHSVK